jgi:hypothetical protein
VNLKVGPFGATDTVVPVEEVIEAGITTAAPEHKVLVRNMIAKSLFIFGIK